MRRINFGLDKYSGLYILAVFIVMFTIWAPALFPTISTVHSIAAGQAVTGILALAVLVPLVGGAYDLSVGATANLTAIVAVLLQSDHHWSAGVAILIAVLTGTVVGLFNGFIIVKLRVNSFIATLGVGSVAAAVQTIFSGNRQPLPPISTTWSALTQTLVGGFSIVVVYLLVIAGVLWWALDHMPFGRYLYAIGGNAEAARLSGVKVGQWTWLSLLISGTLAGVGGVASASFIGPSLTFGQGLLLPAFAAAFLGSTQLKPGRFNVWGTVIAIYVLATGVQGFQYVTGVQWLADMFNGVALVSAVAFAVWRQRARSLRPTDASSERRPRWSRSGTDAKAAAADPGGPGPGPVTPGEAEMAAGDDLAGREASVVPGGSPSA